MSRNPYAPPSASVADPPPPVPIPRPRDVTVAVRLQWLSFVLGFANALVRQAWEVSPIELTAALISNGIYAAIVAWLIVKVWRGRNWARIASTVLSVLGYVSIAFSWPTYSAAWHGHAELLALDGVDALLDIAGLYFMFTRAANAWFRPE